MPVDVEWGVEVRVEVGMQPVCQAAPAIHLTSVGHPAGHRRCWQRTMLTGLWLVVSAMGALMLPAHAGGPQSRPGYAFEVRQHCPSVDLQHWHAVALYDAIDDFLTTLPKAAIDEHQRQTDMASADCVSGQCRTEASATVIDRMGLGPQFAALICATRAQHVNLQPRMH